MNKLMKCCKCSEEVVDLGVHSTYFNILEGVKELDDVSQYVCLKCIIKESGVKTLYHISNETHLINQFEPRIPQKRMNGENVKTKRISLSSSIEGCLSSVPWGGSQLDRVYSEKGGNSIPLRVYEFDIENLNLDCLVPPSYLYWSDSVRDAYITKEYWYIQNLTPDRSYKIRLKGHMQEAEDSISCKNKLRAIKGLKAEAEEIIEGWFTNIIFASLEVI